MDVAKVVKKVATSEGVKAVTLAALMAASKVGCRCREGCDVGCTLGALEGCELGWLLG